MPAYMPGNVITIYGCHEWLEEAIRRQHGAPSFPVEFSQLRADVRFGRLEPGRAYDLAGFRVTAKRQRHTGDSYGYRFERDGRAVVYSTDSEHKLDDPAATRAFAEFFRDADLVIFDAQYSLADSISIKEDWGHSSNVVGVVLCQMARARHLCMFHHEPTYDDAKIAAMLAETRRLEEITRDGHAVQGLGGVGRYGDRSLVPRLPAPSPAPVGSRRPAKAGWSASCWSWFSPPCTMPYVPGLDTLRLSWFDVCQRASPRARASGPVVIVDVDDRSLAAHGQWPWPRTLLAALFERIAAGTPAAIGLDVVMPDQDRLSPQRLPALIRTIGPDLAAQLAALPSNDAVLAAAIRGRPVVLATAGVDKIAEPGSPAAGRMVPVRSWAATRPFLRRYDAMPRAGRSCGSRLRPDQRRPGGRRRAPDPAGRAGRWRHDADARARDVPGGGRCPRAHGDGGQGRDPGCRRRRLPYPHAARRLGVAPLHRPDAGALRLGDRRAGRNRRARRVRSQARARGVTALGLSDRRTIAGGLALDGVEIHAELIESIFDHALLARPPWAPWAEAGFLFAAGVLLVLALSARRTREPAPAAGAGGPGHRRQPGALPLALPAARRRGPVDQAGDRLHHDAEPTLAETERQRSALRRQVEQQRLVAARIEGELSAARRIQMFILPKPADVLTGEKRFGLSIVLQPALETGGDLYDFFKLDADRLFFMLGDVTGKGLAGSLFMVVSKSLYKSTALRRGDSVAKMMREANAEISRDNSEDYFVTVFAAVLDAQTGALEYCNAGHERPYVVATGRGPKEQLRAASGPPLCVMEDYAYAAAKTRLRRGDCLVLFTDGVTDARNTTGEMFGRPRLEALLAALPSDARPEAITTAIQNAVTRFAAGTEPADDVAILVLRWDGPAS
jgi:serine phosphatase RsbU (regulator of sigma subunit)